VARSLDLETLLHAFASSIFMHANRGSNRGDDVGELRSDLELDLCGDLDLVDSGLATRGKEAAGSLRWGGGGCGLPEHVTHPPMPARCGDLVLRDDLELRDDLNLELRALAPPRAGL
jgi:hypothetical protein